MTHDYKSDRERLEKTLPDIAIKLDQFFIDQKSVVSERKGVNDFLALLVERLRGRRTITRDELATISEEYAGLHPLCGEPAWKEGL